MSDWQQDDMFPETISEEQQAEAMYQAAVNMPYEQKVDNALALIKSFSAPVHVRFSGGKDSIVLAELYKMSGIEHELHISNVSIDPPELVYFVRKYYPQAIWYNTGKNLPLSTVNHSSGLPTRRGRWCCDEFKHSTPDDGKMRAVGVRATESPRRKGLWRTITKQDGIVFLSPILYFTDEDIWRFIREHNLPYPTLYDEGFKRLGCVGCPLNPPNRIKEFKRWPRYEALWKKGGRLWWEKYSRLKKANGDSYFAAKFATFEDYWSWWMEEKNVHDTDEPDCQMYLW